MVYVVDIDQYNQFLSALMNLHMLLLYEGVNYPHHLVLSQHDSVLLLQLEPYSYYHFL